MPRKMMAVWCCPSSIRWLILLLSFIVLSSLFANLQLFNLFVLYTKGEQQQLLMPTELDDGGGTVRSPNVVNWAPAEISQELSTAENNSKSAISHTAHTTATTTSMKKVAAEHKLMKAEEIDADEYGDDPYDYSALDAKGRTRENTTTTTMASSGRRKKIKAQEKRVKTKREAYAEVVDEEADYPQQPEEEFNPEQQRVDFELMQGKIQLLAQSLLFSAPGLAILVGHFPCYVLIRRYGAHRPIFGALLVSAIITGAFPFIMDLDAPLPFVMLSRILLGLSVAPTFSFIGQMSAQWATVGEQLFFVLVGFLAIQFGPMLSWFSTVNLLRFDNQLRVFGFHSVVSFLLALIWLFFYRDQPQKHQMVNGEELNYIVKKKPRSGRPLRLPTSLFCLLLRSTSAWACWLASFCYFFALLSLLIFYPIFLHKVLRQTLDHSLVHPLILLFLSHLLFHAFASCSTTQSATWKVRVFNSVAFTISALFFLGIAIIPGNNALSSVRRLWLFWFCLLPLGITTLGFIKSTVVTGGGHFTQYMVSHMQLAFGLAYALVPTLLFSSMSEGSIVHWRLLFLSCAMLLLLGMAIFVILGRGTPTSWAEQWTEDARGDEPLLLIKFSPRHQSAVLHTQQHLRAEQ